MISHRNTQTGEHEMNTNNTRKEARSEFAANLALVDSVAFVTTRKLQSAWQAPAPRRAAPAVRKSLLSRILGR
jgi:hypothetical protein